jgi:hypothetical protein
MFYIFKEIPIWDVATDLEKIIAKSHVTILGDMVRIDLSSSLAVMLEVRNYVGYFLAEGQRWKIDYHAPTTPEFAQLMFGRGDGKPAYYVTGVSEKNKEKKTHYILNETLTTFEFENDYQHIVFEDWLAKDIPLER